MEFRVNGNHINGNHVNGGDSVVHFLKWLGNSICYSKAWLNHKFDSNLETCMYFFNMYHILRGSSHSVENGTKRISNSALYEL